MRRSLQQLHTASSLFLSLMRLTGSGVRGQRDHAVDNWTPKKRRAVECLAHRTKVLNFGPQVLIWCEERSPQRERIVRDRTFAPRVLGSKRGSVPSSLVATAGALVGMPKAWQSR